MEQVHQLILLRAPRSRRRLSRVLRVPTSARVLVEGVRVLLLTFFIQESQVDVACHRVVDVLELTLVFEVPILIDSFLEWLELKAVLPDEKLEDHANAQLVLMIDGLIDLKDGKDHLNQAV